MFNFKKLPITHVPEEWIYIFYLNLDKRTKLAGQTLKLNSPFTNEKTPSMFLYAKDGRYKFKDHSSGNQGDSIDLVTKLIGQSTGHEPSFKFTVKRIESDYHSWIKKNGKYESTQLNEEIYNYQLLCNDKIRDWEVKDTEYFESFGHNMDDVMASNVIPLKSYQLGKRIGDKSIWGKVYTPSLSYGFYESSGELLKIYNPHETYMKHITLKNEILGREQMKGKKTLIIASSMKDRLTLLGFKLQIDVIAPTGEKIIIPAKDISMLKELYDNVLTLFDNDSTGVRAMILYKKLYDLDYVYIPEYKDVAELRSSTNEKYAKELVLRKINEKIFKPLINVEETNKEKNWWPESRHPY